MMAERDDEFDGEAASSGRDQYAADDDQHAADDDQLAAELEQSASDRDQEAADRDEAVHDRVDGGGANRAEYARSRRDRSRGTLQRDMSTQTRSVGAQRREDAAVARDQQADERDRAARARDTLATTLDAEIERGEPGDGTPHGEQDGPTRAASDRMSAASSRALAATQREASARDREQAGRDRHQAAIDRHEAAEELAHQHVDHVTSALRRRGGLAAIQREMHRTAEAGEHLVVAYIAVDGLAAVNDAQGRGAGDELLHTVAQTIMRHLRSHDVITRIAGDEFVCSLSSQDTQQVRDRFGQISAQLADTADGATFTVGYADRRDDDTLDALIDRADKQRRGADQMRIEPVSRT